MLLTVLREIDLKNIIFVTWRNCWWLSQRLEKLASHGRTQKMAGCFKIVVFVYAVLQTAVATGDMNQTSALNPTQFFKNINQDASLVTWAHAVNSKEELAEALNSSVMMLETDISSGHVIGETTTNPIPIMAHPPATTSDISLQKWLLTVIEANKSKGIKLDFKNISVVEESLILLKSYKSQISFPVFINADILPGPLNSSATPVDADQFLILVQKWYPECILSVGWTTYYNETDAWYSWQDVTTMFKILQKHEIKQEISFPIRAVFLDRSYQQLRWLTDTLPKSGITVWSGINDAVDASAFTSTLMNYNKDSVYFDLPQALHSDFSNLK
uniref:Menorin-like domain-containing protein n=1 Tax=Strigamia maritima TaxID=126957 RepID=T1JIN1_STRMM